MSPVKDHQARTVPIPGTVVDELANLQAQSGAFRTRFPLRELHAAAKPQFSSSRLL